MNSATPLSKAELLDRLAGGLAAGLTVVTPNTRLAQALSREFDAAQAGKRLLSWETADILALPSLLKRLYEDALYSELATGLPFMLSAAQEQALWEGAIAGSSLSEGLLSPAQAAVQCRQAWQLAHEWRLVPAMKAPGAGGNADSRAFLDWAGRYEAATARFGQTDNARLVDVLLPLLARPQLRKPQCLVLYGFDIATPQQAAFTAALAAQGVQILACGPALRGSGAVRCSYTAARDELRAAAAWARARLEQNPRARIGVVVPNLADARARVARSFNALGVPHDISLGVALDSLPLVHDALGALELAGRETPFENVSRLLRSPFIAGSEAAMAQRARIDAELRERAPPLLRLDILRRRVRGLPDNFVAFHDYREAHISGSKLASEWARAMLQALAELGFGRGRALDSAEYQTLEKVHEAMSAFAALDRVTGRMDYAQALARIRRIAADTVFQPEAQEVQVRIMGVLESAGLEFDHLWVMGLTDEAWPLSARPNPFVPVALQRGAGVPQADALASLDLDKRITAGWAAHNGECVFSHARREDDRDLAMSPLIAAAGEVAPESLAGPLARTTWREAIFAARASPQPTERVADGAPPPLPPGAELHSGGTAVFKDQAACPFKAFAAHRLGAEPLAVPVSGLDALTRGSLVHLAMAHLWIAIGTRAKLAAMSAADIDQALQAAINAASAAITKQSPDALKGWIATLEMQRVVALARDWLAIEATRSDFEVAAVEQKRAVSFGGLTVNAKLDRLDRLPDGGWVVIDYKTGEAAHTAWFGARPDEPQMPLYALSGDEKLVALAYGRLKTGELGFKGVAAAEDLLPGVTTLAKQRSAAAKASGSWDDMLAAWRRELESLGRGFAAGDARVDPKRGDATCQYCGRQALCRISERTAEIPLPLDGGGVRGEGEGRR
jgi:probable DNA repair protein